MITVTRKKTGKKTTFKTCQACYKHIRAVEDNKYRNGHQAFLDSWSFTRHSIRRVLAFYQYVCHIRKKPRQNPEQKLFKLDVLEICLDPSQSPLLLPVTPDMDIQSLLKDWCRVYFQSHGYEFLDGGGEDGKCIAE